MLGLFKASRPKMPLLEARKSRSSSRAEGLTLHFYFLRFSGLSERTVAPVCHISEFLISANSFSSFWR